MPNISKEQNLHHATASIRVRNLSHGFPRAPLLFEGLNFTAQSGEVIGICGPSGSGKSTLLSIVAGWEKPLSGEVLKQGVNRTNWVFQNPHGVARRTALDHVVFPLLVAGNRRVTAARKATMIMESFRLLEVGHQEFRELSGGEAQRLMLARAIASAPDLLLVDEPTAQLDLHTSSTVNQTLGAVADTGAIVFIATHDPDTRAACTRVIDLTAFTPHRNEVDT